MSLSCSCSAFRRASISALSHCPLAARCFASASVRRQASSCARTLALVSSMRSSCSCSAFRSSSISAFSILASWLRSRAAASAFSRIANSSATRCFSISARRSASSSSSRRASSAAFRCASSLAFLAALTSARLCSTSSSAFFKASSSLRRSSSETIGCSVDRTVDLRSSSTSRSFWNCLTSVAPCLTKAWRACARFPRLPLSKAATSWSATRRWLDASFTSVAAEWPLRPLAALAWFGSDFGGCEDDWSIIKISTSGKVRGAGQGLSYTARYEAVQPYYILSASD